MLVDPDFDWELFPPSEARPSRAWAWAAVAAIVACWFVDRPSAIVAAVVAVALPDVREGRRLLRAVPDPAGARICALFRFAWGAWKAGAVGFGLFYATLLSWAIQEKSQAPPPVSILAVLAWMFGFLVSAVLTAAGMSAALRSGMRVWIGEGVNQARTLLLGMIISAFVAGVIMPLVFWASTVGRDVEPEESAATAAVFGGILLSFLFVAPIVIVTILDRISRRVVAERPGKFGPKVPSVGKWNV